MARTRRNPRPTGARRKVVRPIGFFSSLKLELSVIIILASVIVFAMAWILLKIGWSGWVAMPLTLVVALGVTYLFSHGLIAPLRQMRDAADAMETLNSKKVELSV